METFKAFQDAKAPLEKEMLGKMLEEWKDKAELSGDQIESMDSGLKRMFDDYSKINTDRTKDGMEPLPGFRYPVSPDQDHEQQSDEEESSGMDSVVNRFLIVPMTFMVTVISFMMALKIQALVSPYLVAFLSGILYITLSTVYFSMKGKASGDTNEK